MANPKKLAAGSGAAFAVGAIAGVMGNNLAAGPWYWLGFIVFVVVGIGLSAWLTYRGASAPTAPATHAGNNKIGRIVGHGGGPTIGVNYGQATGRNSEPKGP